MGVIRHCLASLNRFCLALQRGFFVRRIRCRVVFGFDREGMAMMFLVAAVSSLLAVVLCLAWAKEIRWRRALQSVLKYVFEQRRCDK